VRFVLIYLAAALASSAACADPLSKSECDYLHKATAQVVLAMGKMADAAESVNYDRIKNRLDANMLKSFAELEAKRNQLVPAMREYVKAANDVAFLLRMCSLQ